MVGSEMTFVQLNLFFYSCLCWQTHSDLNWQKKKNWQYNLWDTNIINWLNIQAGHLYLFCFTAEPFELDIFYNIQCVCLHILLLWSTFVFSELLQINTYLGMHFGILFGKTFSMFTPQSYSIFRVANGQI